MTYTYNMHDGRQQGFYSTNRSYVDIAEVQETKVLDPDFATKR